MIIVHVWQSAFLRYVKRKQHGSPGHAALQLSPQALTPESGYVSLHPGPKGIGVGRTFKALETDVAHYESAKQKHWTQEIEGLDETKMTAYWAKFQKSSTPYSVKDFCSSLVHEILAEGGADDYAKGWDSWALFGVWSPADVRDYSECVIRGMNKKK